MLEKKGVNVWHFVTLNVFNFSIFLSDVSPKYTKNKKYKNKGKLSMFFLDQVNPN